MLVSIVIFKLLHPVLIFERMLPMYFFRTCPVPAVANFTLVWYHVLFTSGGFRKVTLFRSAYHYISICEVHALSFNPISNSFCLLRHSTKYWACSNVLPTTSISPSLSNTVWNHKNLRVEIFSNFQSI